MITIQIAGAGAGKTYGLARMILNLIKEKGSNIHIFALTYTNSAKRKIEFEIIKQNRSYPENLKIETVHSFLLNEIIFPYSNYILNERYHKASIIKLSNIPAFKARKIKFLKDKNIIHTDKVYEKAKLIIDKKCSRNKSEKQKIKVDKVMSFINASIDYLFIDEAQDLDRNALKAFEILSISNMNIHIIGDPKQAIKYPFAFNDFLEALKINTKIEKYILPSNNISRRLPQKVLAYSNQFCYTGQKQTTINNEVGTIAYVESIDFDFESKMTNWINDKNTLVYIDKTQGIYSTSKEMNITLPEIIQERIIASNTKRDSDILIKVACREFAINASRSIRNDYAVKELIKKYSIGNIGKELYAELCQLSKLHIKNIDKKYVVSSIDSIKGLEAETCIFILSPNTIKYFFRETGSDKIFNKEWKKIYVALTRTKNRLIFVIDYSLFKTQNMKSIRNKFVDIGINKLSNVK